MVGDYYLPWGDMPDDEPEHATISIWGQRHLRYLKQHKKAIYADHLFSGKQNAYLTDIDKQANEMLSLLTAQLAQNEGVTESLKASDQVAWVQHMNSIRQRAEETVYSELVYTIAHKLLTLHSASYLIWPTFLSDNDLNIIDWDKWAIPSFKSLRTTI